MTPQTRSFVIRHAQPSDEPFLWEMLYYAAHMAEDGAVSGFEAKVHPDLRRYVIGWGRASDVGVIAMRDGRPIGAAWVRLFLGNDKTGAHLDDHTPELAIAVHPDHIGQGVGTVLLRELFELARGRYSAVVLSVRMDNPAKRLYDRLGFTVVRETSNRVGGKSYIMSKSFR
jgi:ribosomal protein S18 acetylase RimI-like enzyme